jgi:hypothetical protein
MNRWLVAAFLVFTAASARAQVAPGLGFDPSSIDYAKLDRPLALTTSTIELSARLFHTRYDVGPVSGSSTGVVAGASFGVAKHVEVGIESGWDIDPESDWSRVLAAHVVATLIDKRNFDLAFNVLAPLNLGDGDVLPMTQLGLPMRLSLANRFSLFFGHNAVVIGIGDNDVLAIAGNFGFGIEVNRTVALRFDSQLFSTVVIGRDVQTSTTLGDIMPFAASALFAVGERVDLHVGMTLPDLGQGFDFLFVTGGVLARF